MYLFVINVERRHIIGDVSTYRLLHFYGVTALQSHNILIICRHHLPSGVSLACPQDSFRPQSTRMGHYSHLQFIIFGLKAANVNK